MADCRALSLLDNRCCTRYQSTSYWGNVCILCLGYVLMKGKSFPLVLSYPSFRTLSGLWDSSSRAASWLSQHRLTKLRLRTNCATPSVLNLFPRTTATTPNEKELYDVSPRATLIHLPRRVIRLADQQNVSFSLFSLSIFSIQFCDGAHKVACA